MTELEELRLAYAECSRQKNELLTAHKVSAADNAALRERVKVLGDALREAADDIEEWGSYASDYFIKKWDLAGDVARARAALENTP